MHFVQKLVLFSCWFITVLYVKDEKTFQCMRQSKVMSSNCIIWWILAMYLLTYLTEYFYFCKKLPVKALIKRKTQYSILRLLLDVCSITIFYSFRKWNQSISEKGECMVMCGGNCYLILYKKFKMLILQLYSPGYITLANAFTSFE